MAAPTVRDLNSLVNEIGAAYKPQQALLDTDISNAEKFNTQAVAGVDAAKTGAFGQIEQGAQNKGMFFSGFSPDAQAQYTAGTYLPKLAELQQTLAQTRSSLLGKKADINTDISNKAFTTREGDVNALRAWQQAEADRAFQIEQARLEREFQAQQNAAQIAAQQRAAAASRSYSGGGGSSSGGGGSSSGGSVTSNIQAMLTAAAGRDGKVNPSAWKQVASYAAANGLGFKGDNGFASRYWSYANDKHWKDYKNISV